MININMNEINIVNGGMFNNNFNQIGAEAEKMKIFLLTNFLLTNCYKLCSDVYLSRSKKECDDCMVECDKAYK